MFPISLSQVPEEDRHSVMHCIEKFKLRVSDRFLSPNRLIELDKIPYKSKKHS
ncbi:hypothetical protein D3C78_1866110 [compost metagenome]